MSELEEVLQHHGVKGMKWGVRKLTDTINKRTTKRIARLKEGADKYHEKNKNKRVYKKLYSRNLKKFEKRYANKPGKDADMMAKLAAREHIRKVKLGKINAGITLASYAAVADSTMGRNYTGRLLKKVTSPEAIRAGKNVINAIKRSPVRNVDGASFTNVVNMVNAVARR